jgi:hypothetical protein
MGERRNTGRRAGYASAVVVVAAQAALALPACFSSSSGSPGANDAMTPDATSEDAPASPGEDATAVSTPPDAGDATPVDAGADGGEGGPDAGDAAGPSCPSDLGDAAPTCPGDLPSVAYVTPTVTQGVAPAETGGTIANGEYVGTSAVVYDSDGQLSAHCPVNLMFRQTYTLNAGMLRAEEQQSGYPSQCSVAPLGGADGGSGDGGGTSSYTVSPDGRTIYVRDGYCSFGGSGDAGSGAYDMVGTFVRRCAGSDGAPDASTESPPSE